MIDDVRDDAKSYPDSTVTLAEPVNVEGDPGIQGGNTAEVLPPGDNVSSIGAQGGGNFGGNQSPSGSGTFVLSQKAGLFPYVEGGWNVSVSPYGTQPASTMLMSHAGNKYIGIYGQGGVQYDAAAKQLALAYSGNAVGTYTFGNKERGLFTVYPNVMYNAATTGQVANTSVMNFKNLNLLAGGSYRRGDNTGGFELTYAFNRGQQTVAGLSSTLKSRTVTALAWYQKNFGAYAFGFGIGGSYETNGGGYNFFARFGLGLGRRSGAGNGSD